MTNDTTEDCGIPLATLNLQDPREIRSNRPDNHEEKPPGKTTELNPDSEGITASSAPDGGALAAPGAKHDIFRNYGSAEVMGWELDSEFDLSSEFELDGCTTGSEASRDISDFYNDCSCGVPTCDECFFMRFERRSLTLENKILVFDERVIWEEDNYQHVANSLSVLAEAHNNPNYRDSCEGWTRHAERWTRDHGLKMYLRAKEDPDSEDEDIIYMCRGLRKWYC